VFGGVAFGVFSFGQIASALWTVNSRILEDRGRIFKTNFKDQIGLLQIGESNFFSGVESSGIRLQN